ncbi:CopG family antitoxin [Methylophilus flavus]|uniref:CopG family antitoxin n=1 Tax=Methylophilus flavus TaxID=640084 RepID=A0ABW3PHU9_9PROT
MSATDKILGTEEAWDTDALGNEDDYVRVASAEITEQIDEALCLQSISIRLEKSLIEEFKVLAEFHDVGYQPLMRDALKRFAKAEMKNIVSGFVESQRNLKPQKKLPKPEQTYVEKQRKTA